MVLPQFGMKITLADLQSEFGGTIPIAMSEYYSTSSYTSGIQGIPVSGEIRLSATFAGKQLATNYTLSTSPVVKWVTTIESTNGSARIVSCNTLSDNSIVVGGHYTSSVVNFYNSDRSLFKTFTAAGNGGFFIARINSSGMFVWATRIEGWTPTLTNLHSSCTLSDDSTILAIGTYTITSSPLRAFDANSSTVFNASSSSGSRPYIVRFTSNGVPNLFRVVAGAASRAFTTTTLSNGNYVYGIAVFTNTAGFTVNYPNGTSTGLTYTVNNNNLSGGNNMFFLCANNTSGVWTYYISQTNTDKFAWRTSNGSSSGFLISMTSNASSATINNANSTTQVLPAPVGNYDGYLILVDNNGITSWIIQVQGSTGREDIFDSVISTTSSLVYACGNSAGNTSIMNSNGTYFSYTISTASGFVFSANMSGIVQWVVRIDNATIQSISEISTNIVVTGRFTSSLTIYIPNTNTISSTLIGPSVQSMFIAAFNNQGGLLWVTSGSSDSSVTTNIIKCTQNNIIIGGGFQGTTNLSLKNADGSSGLSVSKIATEAAYVAAYF